MVTGKEELTYGQAKTSSMKCPFDRATIVDESTERALSYVTHQTP